MLWYACGYVYVIIYIRMNVCYGIHVHCVCVCVSEGKKITTDLWCRAVWVWSV